MGTNPSLARRAVLAVLLLGGFYVLALAIAGALLWILWADWRFANTMSLRLALFCVAGAGLILWSIVPRPDRFIAPGPELTPSQQPRLFQEIAALATATGQSMPAEVYLVGDLNAWVSERGGVMGVGSRRIMGLGLPLLQTLSVVQLQAVLAHEFGHFYGGDTRLGPWIYKTRAAIGRTLQAVALHSSVRLAARTIGAAPLIEGLKRIATGAPLFVSFWRTELGPLLQQGYCPSLTEGLARFTAVPRVVKAAEMLLAKQIEDQATDPYDTHPSLSQRIAALADFPEQPGDPATPLALSLLQDVAALEHTLLEQLARRHGITVLKPLDWDLALSQAWLPHWVKQIEKLRPRLAGLTPADLGAGLRPDQLAVRLQLAPDEARALPAHQEQARNMLMMAIAVAMARSGWQLERDPGSFVTLVREGQRVDLEQVVSSLNEGTLTEAAWRERCIALGIADLDLGREAT